MNLQRQWLVVGGEQQGKTCYMSEPVKRPEHLGRGYEDSDVSVGRLFAFAAGVVGLIVLGVLGSAAVFHFFVSHQPLGPPASPFENVRTMPPEPRLQTTAPLDLKRYRSDQDKILQQYGWVDPRPALLGFLWTAQWIYFCKRGIRSVEVPLRKVVRRTRPGLRLRQRTARLRPLRSTGKGYIDNDCRNGHDA